jgi:hypothetical protein
MSRRKDKEGVRPEADRLQVARHARERAGYRDRHRNRAGYAPPNGATRERRESYPTRRRAAMARLFAERPEYRARRVGQIVCAVAAYVGLEFPRGPDGLPKDAEVEELLAGQGVA